MNISLRFIYLSFLFLIFLGSPTHADLKSLLDTSKKLAPETKAFYQANAYQSVWFTQGQLNERGKKAITILQHADDEGLNPNDYQKALTIEQEKDSDLAEILLTDEFLRFIHHIRVGRIHPQENARTIKIKSPTTTPIILLQRALEDPEKLAAMAPALPEYQALKTLLAKYRKILDEKGELPKLSQTTKLTRGTKHPEIITLRKILFTLGDLSQQTASEEFDQELEDALKKFQEHHLLTPDGVIGPQTRKNLNMPLEERIYKIIINMERLRWLPDELGSKYIQVNVGGFEVTAIKNGHVDYRIKAIVGKPSTMTPLFYAPLKNIIINPSWHVPPRDYDPR